MIFTVSVILFIGLILATGAERIYELVVSTRNAKLALYFRWHRIWPRSFALHDCPAYRFTSRGHNRSCSF